MTGSATPNLSTRRRRTSTACDKAAPVSLWLSPLVSIFMRKEVPPCKSKPRWILPIASQPVQNCGGRVNLVGSLEGDKIAGDVVGADGLSEVVIGLFRNGLLQLLGLLDNAGERGVAGAGSLPEHLEQVLALGRVKFVKGPQEDEDDDSKSPKIISLHGSKAA